jgi:hypothetical protein
MIGMYKKARFLRIKNKYYSDFKKNKIYKDGSDISDLLKDGYIIKKNFFSKKIINNWKNITKLFFDEILKNKDSMIQNCLVDDSFGKYYFSESKGVLRIIDKIDIFPEINIFFNSPYITNLFSNYLNTKTPRIIKLYSFRFENSFGINTDNISDSWRFDDWKHRLKAMVYLTDVGINKSPLSYIRRSHDLNYRGRFEKEFDYFIHKKNGEFGYLSEKFVENICNENSMEKITIEGSAGDLILFDSRGIHKRTRPNGRERYSFSTFLDSSI